MSLLAEVLIVALGVVALCHAAALVGWVQLLWERWRER